MKIVIPMAGKGQRFVDAGATVPKPMITVLDEPMYAWAMKSLPLELASKVIFIAQREHLEAGLRSDIEQRFGDCSLEIVAIDGITDGQLCTVLLARELIDGDEPVLIFNSDTYFKSPLALMLEQLDSDVQGVISVFRAFESRWSFARVSGEGLITEVQEKMPISEWATTGAYYFKRGRDFLYYADSLIQQNIRTNGEFYVGPVYNLMIKDGAKIYPDYVKEVGVMGTPEDLEAFLAQRRR